MIPTPDSIDSFIEEQMGSLHIPGMAACIVKEDALSWVGTYGYADLDKGLAVCDSTLFLTKPQRKLPPRYWH